MKLDNLELPMNLYWQNEFDHKAIAQSVERTVSGGVVVESSPLSYGQNISLTGDWATRIQVLALQAVEATNAVMTFTDGRDQIHSVVFDFGSGAVQASLLEPETEPTDETLYVLSINLLTVAP